ncbi:class F sortase [Rothia sp. AR01]|uniref:Class F sortase n=2 Tax=Rothia santali TaxID=2949643 RepID=A0A9X2H9N1_9MICC|nr:class F sortase [Rothia santali]
MGSRGGLLASAAAAVLLLAGCASGSMEEASGAGASPSPEASTAAPDVSESASPAEATPTAAAASPGAESPAASPSAVPDLPPVMERSAPVTLAIPSIGVDTLTLHLGLQDNDALDVPPTNPGAPASWYDGSPTPGERGPSVFLGHVNDTAGGEGVFANLRSLNPGDTVKVTREDGSVATFAVTRGEAYAKNEFPTFQVYGNTDDAELRLITCDGYDPETGLFDDNYVVYASLVP